MGFLSTVYTSNMSGKVTLLIKHSVTDLTGISRTSLMHALDVVSKSTPMCEVFTTVSTGERSLTLVHTPDVMVKITPMWEVFATVITGERFLTLMDTLDVLVKIILAIKHFGTSLTCIARTSVESPNMELPTTISGKTFPTPPTRVSDSHPLVRLYLYFNLRLH